MSNAQPTPGIQDQIDRLRAEADAAGAAMEWAFERADLYEKAMALARDHRLDDIAERSWWDFQLFRMSQAGVICDGEARFGPMAEFPDGTKFPDPDSLPHAALGYYADRARELNDPIARARYADFLWTQHARVPRAHEFAQLAIEAYLDSVPLFAEKERWFSVEDALVRSLALAIEINHASLRQRARTAVVEWSERLAASDETIRYTLEIIRRVAQLKAGYAPVELRRFAVLAEQAARFYRGKGANELLEQHFWRARIQILRIAGVDEVGLREARLAYADAQEHAARLAGKRSRLVEASLLLNAIASYQAEGAKEKVEELQREMAEATAAAKAEFKPISATVQLPAGTVDMALDVLTEGDLPRAIERIALHAVPSVDEAEQHSAAAKAHAPLTHLLGRTILREGNIVYRTNSEADQSETAILEQFQLAYSFKFAMLVGPALDRLVVRGLEGNHVLDLLRRPGWYETGTLDLVAKGLQLYFEQRHLEAIYVLAPQLEELLRQLVRANAAATTVLRARRGGVDEISLERVLEMELIERLLGRDYKWFALHTLADPRGENLRNEVAHGLLRSSDRDRTLADIILVHLVLLGMPKRSDDYA